MQTRRQACTSLVVVTMGLMACEGSSRPPPSAEAAPSGKPSAARPGVKADNPSVAAPSNISVNDFLKRGTPTFVRGTSGDELADSAVRAQVDLIRQLFPDAKVVDDTSVDAAAGPKGWPKNPVVYGGPHVNELLSKLALPFELSAGKLTLGEETLKGDGFLLMAVVPARKADDKGPGYPEFLLYAGTGTPGVAEINSVHHGADPILVADTFGKLTVGTWTAGDSGRIEAKLSKDRARRIAWRAEERELDGHGEAGESTTVRFMFPKKLPAADDESRTIDACMRGLAAVVSKLEIDKPVATTVYVHPDRRSKKSLTGFDGDGHAAIASDALHVIRFEPASLEKLMAHEGTHVLAYRAWGPAGSPLLGEGLAVWVSGYYAGKSLSEHNKEIHSAPRIAELLKLSAFRKLPEAQTYPVAGILVDVIVKEVGASHLRDHLLGATMDTWKPSCDRAGTTPAVLQDALSKALN